MLSQLGRYLIINIMEFTTFHIRPKVFVVLVVVLHITKLSVLQVIAQLLVTLELDWKYKISLQPIMDAQQLQTLTAILIN